MHEDCLTYCFSNLNGVIMFKDKTNGEGRGCERGKLNVPDYFSSDPKTFFYFSSFEKLTR